MKRAEKRVKCCQKHARNFCEESQTFVWDWSMNVLILTSQNVKIRNNPNNFQYKGILFPNLNTTPAALL